MESLNLPSVPNLPDLSELDAFKLFRQQQEREGRRLKLSRFSFFTDAIRITGSVLPRIYGSVFWITLWSAIVAAADIVYQRGWTAPSSVIGPLSFVVTLLVVYRNTSAFDRWYEGRKQFQDAQSNIRNLSRFIWLNFDIRASIPTKIEVEIDEIKTIKIENVQPSEKVLKRRFERKKRALRLLVLFLYSTKHLLREENGIEWEDYDGILPVEIKKLWSKSKNSTLIKKSSLAEMEGKGKSSSKDQGLRSRFNGEGSSEHPSSSTYSTSDLEASETTPLNDNAYRSGSKISTKSHSLEDFNENLSKVPISLPLLTLWELSRYFTGCKKSGMINDLGPAGFNNLNTAIASLTSELGNMERIVTTQIPVIYGIHLKQATLLYLIALPLTLVSELSWRMIPFVTLVSITLIGLEGIASEVESPFGDDASDHPLDLFCASMRHEIEHLMVSHEEGVGGDGDEPE